MTAAVQLVEDPKAVRVALSPMRRRLLEVLKEPMSATEASARLGLTRQRVNYHLGVLERAGLVELVEVRPRRGFTERVVRTVADLVVDPEVLGAASPSVAGRDRFAAAHLVATAGHIVRDVSRMQATAETRQQRLLTFTVETELTFAQPADVHRFTDELASALAELARRFNHSEGRPYRIVLGGHPAVGTAAHAPSGGVSP